MKKNKYGRIIEDDRKHKRHIKQTKSEKFFEEQSGKERFGKRVHFDQKSVLQIDTNKQM